ncbi:hypothetical protein FQR65_LT14550 [Abscondita terminalis]|nr:hypothetical protein FQR65_LT14550 [Abscondita terminalis]
MHLAEKIQLKFFKILLHLPMNTPDYYIRLETGQTHIAINIWKRVLLFWQRIVNLPDTRYTKLLYKRLLELDELKKNRLMKYNWVTKVREFCLTYSNENFWAKGKSGCLNKEDLINVIKKLSDTLKQQDINALQFNKVTSNTNFIMADACLSSYKRKVCDRDTYTSDYENVFDSDDNVKDKDYSPSDSSCDSESENDLSNLCFLRTMDPDTIIAVSSVIIASALAITALNKKRHRRYAVRPMNRRRDEYGHYSTLVRFMKDNDHEQFFKYCRMSPAMYDHLLALMSPHLQKDVKKMHLSPGHRLTITLHYLAEGCSMQQIAWDYYIGKATAHFVIKSTCQALWKVLSPIYLPKPNKADWEDIADEDLPMSERKYCPTGFADYVDSEGNFHFGQWRTTETMKSVGRMGTNNPTRNAQKLRETLKQYFNSDIGCVPWQQDIILQGSLPSDNK